jgi:hypothetical protein
VAKYSAASSTPLGWIPTPLALTDTGLVLGVLNGAPYEAGFGFVALVNPLSLLFLLTGGVTGLGITLLTTVDLPLVFLPKPPLGTVVLITGLVFTGLGGGAVPLPLGIGILGTFSLVFFTLEFIFARVVLVIAFGAIGALRETGVFILAIVLLVLVGVLLFLPPLVAVCEVILALFLAEADLTVGLLVLLVVLLLLPMTNTPLFYNL